MSLDLEQISQSHHSSLEIRIIHWKRKKKNLKIYNLFWFNWFQQAGLAPWFHGIGQRQFLTIPEMSKKPRMWHFGTLFSGECGSAGFIAGLSDLRLAFPILIPGFHGYTDMRKQFGYRAINTGLHNQVKSLKMWILFVHFYYFVSFYPCRADLCCCWGQDQSLLSLGWWRNGK